MVFIDKFEPMYRDLFSTQLNIIDGTFRQNS